MSSDVELSRGFYPGTDGSAPQRQAAQVPQRTTDEEVATALFGKTTPTGEQRTLTGALVTPSTALRDMAIEAPLTTDEDASSFYDGKAMLQTTTATIERAAVHDLGLASEDAKQVAADWTDTFARFGVNGTEADALVAAGLAVHVNGVDEEQVAEWESTAIEQLKTDYGERWQQALLDARALVRSDP
jgi:hypothetical protein